MNCENVAFILLGLAVIGLWWWFEIGSAKRDMMRAFADTRRSMGPPPRRRGGQWPKQDVPTQPPPRQGEDLHQARSKDFARRVEVEQHLLDCASGKRPLPDAATCLALAHQLGIPDEYR